MEVLENEYHLVGPDAISMNKVTCSHKRGDCLLSSTPKAVPKRRKKGEDDCICEETTDDETVLENTRRRSPPRAPRARRRRTRILDVETGEDAGEEEEEEAVLDTDDEDEKSDNGKESSITAENGEDVGRTYPLGKEKSTGLARYNPINYFRRRSARIQERSARGENGDATAAHETLTRRETSTRSDEDDSIIEGTQSGDLNDAHQGSLIQIQTTEDNKRDRELKRWIKRCQEECVRQGRRRRNN
ncbi:uncharacterized protein LOC143219104 [Lasioglossum baleicum]|uniref:uncharacterized protein LOC143219104 n=1 Tax=Lasioglossum baleicum TaxID=434251 RepID=UPI003FCC8187